MEPLHVTSSSFAEEVLQSSLPVLVDFYADWCGPCKMLAPVMAELTAEYTGKLKVTKLNVDDAQDIASQYSVMSIPTLILFRNGKPEHQTLGFQAKDAIIREFKL